MMIIIKKKDNEIVKLTLFLFLFLDISSIWDIVVTCGVVYYSLMNYAPSIVIHTFHYHTDYTQVYNTF